MNEEEQQKLESEIEDLTRKIEKNPQNPDFYFFRGNTYDELNRYQEALDDFDKAILLKDDDPDFYNNRGITYGKLNRYQEALDDFDKAILLKDDNPIFYFNRGNTYFNLNRYEEALSDYSEAIEANKDNPHNPAFYFNRGNTYFNLNRYEEALSDYSKAILLKDDKPHYYYNRGNTYGKLERYQEALDDFNKAIQLKNDDPDFYFFRGVTYANLQCYEKALDDFNEAIKREPDNLFYQKNRSILLWLKQEDEKFNKNDMESLWEIEPSVLALTENYFLEMISFFKQKELTDTKVKNLVYHILKLRESLKCRKDDKDFVYQYTSLGTVNAIILNKKLRLTPADYQNDPDEGFFYQSLFDKEVSHLFQVKNLTNQTAFIRCFTENIDDLVMWNSSYAGNGDGGAIGISKDCLKSSDSGIHFSKSPLSDSDSKETPGNISEENEPETDNRGEIPLPLSLSMAGFFKVLYLNKEDYPISEASMKKENINDCQKLTSEDIFKNICGILNDMINDSDITKMKNEYPEKFNTLKEGIQRALVPIAHLIKSKDYEHEKEWRLIFVADIGVKEVQKYIHCEKKDCSNGIYLETEPFLFGENKEGKKNTDYEIIFGPKVDKVVQAKIRHSAVMKGVNITFKTSNIRFR